MRYSVNYLCTISWGEAGCPIFREAAALFHWKVILGTQWSRDAPDSSGTLWTPRQLPLCYVLSSCTHCSWPATCVCGGGQVIFQLSLKPCALQFSSIYQFLIKSKSPLIFIMHVYFLNTYFNYSCGFYVGAVFTSSTSYHFKTTAVFFKETFIEPTMCQT